MRHPIRFANPTAVLKLPVIVGCALLASLSVSNSASAGSGLISSYVNLTTNGSVDWYQLENPGSGQEINFSGLNLGTFDLSTDTLAFTGGQVNSYKNGSSDVTSASISYRVYPVGVMSLPSFTDLNISFKNDASFTDAGGNTYVNGGDQKWESIFPTHNINLLSGLTNGEYALEVYARITTNNDGDHYHNNGGVNYTATFSAVPEPSAFLFGRLICGVLGVVHTLKSRRQPNSADVA